MPNIVTRGAGAELSYQQGDEHFANPQLQVTGNLSLDEAHNREHLVITSGTVTLTLDDGTALNAALNSTSGGAEKIGWVTKISNNSGNTATIDLATATETLNGTVNGTFSLTDNSSVIIGFDNLSTPKGYNILGEYDANKVVSNDFYAGSDTVTCANTAATYTIDFSHGLGTDNIDFHGKILASLGVPNGDMGIIDTNGFVTKIIENNAGAAPAAIPSAPSAGTLRFFVRSLAIQDITANVWARKR